MPRTTTIHLYSDDVQQQHDFRERRLPHYLQPLPDYLHKQALNLLAKLHTCLDIETLLHTFSDGLDLQLPDYYLSVDCPDCYVPIIVDPGQKQCQFHIIIEDVYLCDLGLYSHQPIDVHSEQQLSMWLNVLAYPLRNAISLHKMRMQVFRDPLTGIQNRIAMQQAVGREIASAQRHQNDLSLLVVDIDHFKAINDRYGHSCGDVALQTSTHVMRSCLRNSDQIFRYGGEEFVVLLTHTEPVGAYVLAERMRQAMAQRDHIIGDIRIPITVSIGIATMQWNDSVDSLFDKADKALYMAKNSGRNRVSCLDQGNERNGYQQQPLATASQA